MGGVSTCLKGKIIIGAFIGRTSYQRMSHSLSVYRLYAIVNHCRNIRGRARESISDLIVLSMGKKPHGGNPSDSLVPFYSAVFTVFHLQVKLTHTSSPSLPASTPGQLVLSQEMAESARVPEQEADAREWRVRPAFLCGRHSF